MNVLLIEDSEEDFLLIQHALQRADEAVNVHWEKNPDDISTLLYNVQWDIVLSDYYLDGKTCLPLINTIKQVAADLPIIILSGSLGEESVVEVMRAGVQDFILKDSLKRLYPAVEREVKEYYIRLQHQETKRQLESAKLQFESLFQETRSVMLMVDPANGSVIEFNKSALEYFGYGPVEVMPECQVTDLLELQGHSFEYLLEELGKIIPCSIFLNHLGEWREAELIGSLATYDTQSILFCVINDVTDRKRAERALKLAEEELAARREELDNFIYKVSHDVRAPVCSIQGLLQLIKVDSTPATQDVYLNMISSRVEKLDRFIREVLSYAENLSIPVNYEAIELDKIVREAFDKLQYMDKWRRIDVTVSYRAIGSNTIFISDKSRLFIIFENLIANAIQFMKDKEASPRLAVTIEVSQQEARLAFADNGIGILPEFQHRIFEMFFRGSEKSEGAGLGLYIVMMAVKKLGGHIHVESEPYHGSTFYLTIPNSNYASSPEDR